MRCCQWDLRQGAVLDKGTWGYRDMKGDINVERSNLSLIIKTIGGKIYNLTRNGENTYMTFNDDGFPCTYRIEGYRPLALGKHLSVTYYAMTYSGALQRYEYNSNEPIADMMCHEV